MFTASMHKNINKIAKKVTNSLYYNINLPIKCDIIVKGACGVRREPCFSLKYSSKTADGNYLKGVALRVEVIIVR